MESMGNMHDKFDSFKKDIAEIQSKLTKVEDEQKNLSKRVSSVEFKSKKHESDVQKNEERIKASEVRLQEEIERLKRSANIILFGIEETTDGVAKAQALLRMLLPAREGGFAMNRVGAPAPGQSQPRPLRVLLNNAGEKYLALRNRVLLKGREEYNGVGVRADETKRQREARTARSPVTTRAHTRNKRAMDNDGESSQNQAKSRRRLEQNDDSSHSGQINDTDMDDCW